VISVLQLALCVIAPAIPLWVAFGIVRLVRWLRREPVASP